MARGSGNSGDDNGIDGPQNRAVGRTSAESMTPRPT